MPLNFRGYSVHIESDGKELPQYQVEKTDDSTITCWIPSEAGKTFSAHFSTLELHEHDHKTVRVFADGRRLSGLGSADSVSDKISYRETSANTRQRFVFSEVAFAPDDDDENSQVTIPDDVGVIDVQVWVAVEKKYKKPYRRIEESTAVDQGIKLTEKSKLIGANQVMPSATEAFVPEVSYYGSTSIGDKPYALFRFKHRPLNVLQAMGIVSRPVRAPSPPARRSRSGSENPGRETVKRRRIDGEEQDIKPVIDEDLEERRRKIREELAAEEAKAAARQAALRAQLEELGASGSNGGARVKAERAPSPISVPRPGEVIDLLMTEACTSIWLMPPDSEYYSADTRSRTRYYCNTLVILLFRFF